MNSARAADSVLFASGAARRPQRPRQGGRPNAGARRGSAPREQEHSSVLHPAPSQGLLELGGHIDGRKEPVEGAVADAFPAAIRVLLGDVAGDHAAAARGRGPPRSQLRNLQLLILHLITSLSSLHLPLSAR